MRIAKNEFAMKLSGSDGVNLKCRRESHQKTRSESRRSRLNLRRESVRLNASKCVSVKQWRLRLRGSPGAGES